MLLTLGGRPRTSKKFAMTPSSTSELPLIGNVDMFVVMFVGNQIVVMFNAGNCDSTNETTAPTSKKYCVCSSSSSPPQLCGFTVDEENPLVSLSNHPFIMRPVLIATLSSDDDDNGARGVSHWETGSQPVRLSSVAVASRRSSQPLCGCKQERWGATAANVEVKNDPRARTHRRCCCWERWLFIVITDDTPAHCSKTSPLSRRVSSMTQRPWDNN